MNRSRRGFATLGLLLGLVGVVGASQRPALEQSARASSSTPVSNALPGANYELTLWNGSPFIDLAVDGVPGRFLFDTGANVSGIDRNWLWSSGIPYRSGFAGTLAGTTGGLSVSTAVIDQLVLGNGSFSNASFYVEDFSGFGLPGGQAEAGLLAMDFIGCYAVTLDLANARLGLALANERPAPSPDEWALPLDLSQNLPTVTVSLEGLSVPCRLDTGDAYLDPRPFLDVNQATVDALTAAGVHLAQTGTVTVAGVSGVETLPLLESSPGWSALSLQVGPANVSGIVLVVHDQGTLAVSAPIALAGAPILTKLGTLRIDPFDQKLYLPISR